MVASMYSGDGLAGPRSSAVFLLQSLIWQAGERLPRIDRLEAEGPGALFLLGSGGVGKSSLLRALATGGWRSGEASLGGIDLRALPIRLLEQGPRSRASPRPPGIFCPEKGPGFDDGALSRLSALFSEDAALYLLDEPTAGLKDSEFEAAIELIREKARERLLVIATHDRRLPLALGGTVALLAERGLVASAPAEEFFRHPPNAAARCYVASGGFHDAEAVALPREDGVWWVVPGVLAGMSRPGLAAPMERQLDYLKRHGVHILFNLEERLHYERQQVIGAGIGFMHVPVRDMHPPSLTQSLALCRSASRVIEQGGAVVFHCRGGLGRTGAALACLLIWHGDTAEQALKRVRKVEPLAVQTEAQVRFLQSFEETVCSWS